VGIASPMFWRISLGHLITRNQNFMPSKVFGHCGRHLKAKGPQELNGGKEWLAPMLLGMNILVDELLP
jgi:hypothetical protein